MDYQKAKEVYATLTEEQIEAATMAMRGFSCLPMTGRYGKVNDLFSEFGSEFALNRNRLEMEITYLNMLCDVIGVKLSEEEQDKLYNMLDDFDVTEFFEMKAIEETTKHDVKAVEYYIRGKLDEKVDVSSFEAEREGLRTQLVQATGAKDKLMQQLDRLDVTDRHYDRKYQDMQDRLDTLYDRIADMEEKIDDVTDKISGAYDENLTSKQLCKVLLQFDEMFEEMTDLERKEFLYTLIERIDLFPERQENGSILKRIRFKFRVDYDAEAGGRVLLNENDVETVVMLSHEKTTA